MDTHTFEPQTRINYEWCYETHDNNGDIVDHNFADELEEFHVSDMTDDLVLVRTEPDGSRYWAYMKKGELPEYFWDTRGETDIKVPQRFHTELKKYLKD